MKDFLISMCIIMEFCFKLQRQGGIIDPKILSLILCLHLPHDTDNGILDI